MSKIEINGCIYYIHPIYNLYASNEDGYIINIIRQVPMKTTENNRGYLLCGVRKHGQKGYKTCLTHRFIWECFNGLITDNKVIDHINNIKDDNRLCNLQLITQSENTLKSVKYRDCSNIKNTMKNPRCVKATNVGTKEVSYFSSMYCCSRHLDISNATIKRVCDRVDYRKSGKSKKDGYSYKFEYVEKEDLPANHFKSANKRKNRVPDEDKKSHHALSMKKWTNKEYKCPRCDKVMKNNNRQYHRKTCN